MGTECVITVGAAEDMNSIRTEPVTIAKHVTGQVDVPDATDGESSIKVVVRDIPL